MVQWSKRRLAQRPSAPAAFDICVELRRFRSALTKKCRRRVRRKTSAWVARTLLLCGIWSRGRLLAQLSTRQTTTQIVNAVYPFIFDSDGFLLIRCTWPQNHRQQQQRQLQQVRPSLDCRRRRSEKGAGRELQRICIKQQLLACSAWFVRSPTTPVSTAAAAATLCCSSDEVSHHRLMRWQRWPHWQLLTGRNDVGVRVDAWAAPRSRTTCYKVSILWSKTGMD